ncbi:MAG: hypothetical protein H2058_08940 [Muricauda sp.]|nr:hypothetical protein [Allomuricauda sp.]MBA4745372.1 hypothetical protein [Allomuricauda sp.]
MKQLKNLLPVMLLALLAWNCEKDDAPLSPPHHKNVVNIQTLTLEELNQKESLKKPLGKIDKLLDVNKTTNHTSKLKTTDGSFTVLTKDIVELTTSNSKSYSFRTETPVYPEADFENLVIYKKDGETFKFYLYSYKYIFFEGEWQNYIISIVPIDAEALGLENLVENFTSKMLLANNCLWNIVGYEISLVWCFGSNNGNFGMEGNGSSSPISGCEDWVYFNPDGIGKCVRTRGCVDSNGNVYSITEYNVQCSGNVVHGENGGGNDGGNNENYDGDVDDNWGIEDGPINDGPVNGGGTPNNDVEEEIVPVNPPVDYVQTAELCLGLFGNNYNIPQDTMEDLGKYIYENSCNDPFVSEAINALQHGDNEVDFEEKIIYLLEDYPCQADIIKDALAANSPVTDLVMDIFNSDVKPSITIQADDLDDIFWGGYTTVQNGTPFHYLITINTERLDVSTDIDIASITIHESVHALLFYFYQAGSFQSENESYAQLVEDFTIHQASFGGDHHEYMQNLVGYIADALYEWAINSGYSPSDFLSFNTIDNNNYDGLREYLDKLAWNGLTDTGTFELLYPEGTLERQNIIQLINSESLPYENSANPKGTICD